MYKNKYLKYKLKYLELKNQLGASLESTNENPLDETVEGDEGDWEFESNVEEMINNYYIKLGYPVDKNKDAVYYDIKNDKMDKIINLVLNKERRLGDNVDQINEHSINLKLSNTKFALKQQLDQQKEEEEAIRQQRLAEEEAIRQQEEDKIQERESVRIEKETEEKEYIRLKNDYLEVNDIKKALINK